jgi:hypothetical protein
VINSSERKQDAETVSCLAEMEEEVTIVTAHKKGANTQIKL